MARGVPIDERQRRGERKKLSISSNTSNVLEVSHSHDSPFAHFQVIRIKLAGPWRFFFAHCFRITIVIIIIPGVTQCKCLCTFGFRGLFDSMRRAEK